MSTRAPISKLKKWCAATAAGAALVFAGPAAALDYDLWLPYLRAHDHGSVAPFGDANADSMYQLPAPPTDPNFIWNSTQVSTGSGDRSYFDQTHSQKRWRIVIHNKSTSSRTASLKLQNASDGSTVTATTKWLFTGIPTPPSTLPNLLKSSFPTGYTWDSANNEIDFTLAAESTRVLEMEDFFSISGWTDATVKGWSRKLNFHNAAVTSTPYNIATASTGAYFPATARLIVRGATNDKDVEMYVEGWDAYRPRSTTNSEISYSVDQTHVIQWGYQAFRKPATPGSNQVNKLLFPYFRQHYRANFNVPSPYTAKTVHEEQSESFHIFLVNAHTATDTLLIKAWSKDGYSLYGEDYVTLAPGEESVFLCSQLLWTDGPFEGYIEIYGKNPVAVGYNVKYGRPWASTASKVYQSPNLLTVVPATDLVNCCGAPCNIAWCFGGLN